MTYTDATLAAAVELKRALDLYPNLFFNNHEGYAVILEELDELWEEVRKKDPDPLKLREEAIQVAAMALKFAAELT